jgi:NADPH:quinone reductase-like Zn-dependent oxidoreductase
MKAAIVTGPTVAPVYGEFPYPALQEGEIRVGVTASALSHLTRARASGSHYSAQNEYPFVPGVDGVGRLEDGTRVYFAMPRSPFGAMAEQSVVRASHVVPVPDDISDVAAAAVANAGMSSWAALRHRARFKAGETVLVNGATGASGQLAVRIAKHLGAEKVIATGRNPQALAALLRNGADAVISLLDQDFGDQLQKHSASGIDVVLDYLWGNSAFKILGAAAKYGPAGRAVRFIQIGSMAGTEVAIPASILRSSCVELLGSGIGSVSLENLVSSIGEMLATATAAGLDVATQPVPLSEIADAWIAEESSRRIVFTV